MEKADSNRRNREQRDKIGQTFKRTKKVDNSSISQQYP